MTEPDWDALYADAEITPATAALLHTNAEMWWDLHEDDLDALREDLPPILRNADDVFVERFRQCFVDIRDRLAKGLDCSTDVALCTGDELALHLVIGWAEAQVSDGSTPPDPTVDLDMAAEVLFHDHDVLELFNPAFDGIENDVEFQRQRAMANLHPDQWFLPFRPGETAT